jgi:two-component system cell cycle response regulator
MATKILTVDDSKTIRMIIKRTFANYDCDIHEASNGQEGLTLAAAQPPDLIILDITMPIMDGITMLGRLKETAALKSIPVIILSAESGRENVAFIAKLGVRDYLVKPFKEEQLIEKVSRIVSLHKK